MFHNTRSVYLFVRCSPPPASCESYYRTPSHSPTHAHPNAHQRERPLPNLPYARTSFAVCVLCCAVLMLGSCSRISNASKRVTPSSFHRYLPSPKVAHLNVRTQNAHVQRTCSSNTITALAGTPHHSACTCAWCMHDTDSYARRSAYFAPKLKPIQGLSDSSHRKNSRSS